MFRNLIISVWNPSVCLVDYLTGTIQMNTPDECQSPRGETLRAYYPIVIVFGGTERVVVTIQ